MSQVLTKIKALGEDAIIVATDEHPGQVTLTAAVEDNRCVTLCLRAIETPQNKRARHVPQIYLRLSKTFVTFVMNIS